MNAFVGTIDVGNSGQKAQTFVAAVAQDEMSKDNSRLPGQQPT